MRRDQEKTSSAEGTGKDTPPGGASEAAASSEDWKEDAKDQISALLGQVEEYEEEDDLLDLEAIRRALAEQQANALASEADETPAAEEQPEASPEPREPRKRLEWLDKLLGVDRTPAGPETPSADPATDRTDETAADSRDEASPDTSDEPPLPGDPASPAAEADAAEAETAAADEAAEDAADEEGVEQAAVAEDGTMDAAVGEKNAGPPAEQAASPAAPDHAPKQAATERLFKDVVMMDLLQRGVVTFPQAMQVLEQEPPPDQALWRLAIDQPGIDRDRVFEAAAGLHGFAPVDLETAPVSADFIRAVVRMLPPDLQEHLFTINLLPLQFAVDPASRNKSLLLVTHDPLHPDVPRFGEALNMSVKLHYAPQAAVARCLARARASEDATDTAGPETPAQQDAGHPPKEIVDLSDDAGFFELNWEPFTEEDDPAGTEPPAGEAAPPEQEADPLSWKSLADLIDQAEDGAPAADPDAEAPPRDRPAVSRPAADVAPDEPAQAARADMSPASEVMLEESAGARDPGREEQDGEAAETSPDGSEASSLNGSTVDLSDHAPATEIAPWTLEEDAPTDEGPGPGIDASDMEEISLEALPDVDLEKIKAKDRVVAMLLRKGIVTPKQIKKAQYKQKEDNLKEPMWRVLTTIDGAPRNAIFAEAATVYAFKTADVADRKPDPEFARSVMDTFDEALRDALLKLRVVPLEVDLDQQTGAIKVVFITHDPTRPEVHRTMQKLKLERFELRYAPENVVTGLILEAFPRRNEFLERIADDNAFDLGTSYDQSNELVDEDALEAEISRSKLINLFEATLVEAVRQGASDVHIWPNAKKQVEIHFRVDGRLQRWHLEDKIHPEALTAVIKDNAMNVDRFERDSAQDGFIQRWIDEALIRFRVSVLPIANAATDVRSESIVIRVLDDRKVIKDLRKLGLHETSYQRFSKAIRQPHGMVILTGPTGSGKTTTLYASLHEVVSPEVNVLTVEDPVEYILPGVRQIKLNHKLGLEGALRSILRHDPDIVMVGEMRDKDTAELAIKLANTGHLTFSTLHTNDAASAVTRLYKMGIEPFLIAYAINLVVAQRLIRRLCTQCKREDPDPDPVLLKNLGFTPEEIGSLTFYMEGQNDDCPMCKGLSYKGRRAVTEALYFSREIRHLIADSQGKLDEQDIKDLACKQGMLTLQDSAREVVKEGDTSILEMLRVISTED